MPGLLNVPESMSIALHTCLWIADGERAFRSSPKIAKELGFSYNHFAKVVQKLVHAGLLETERGPRGGIRLAGHEHDVAAFEAAGCAPFVHETKDKAVPMSYWSVPEDALDSPQEFRPWAHRAWEAALRKPKPKPKPKKAAKKVTKETRRGRKTSR